MNVESYVRIDSDSIKNVNEKTKKIWEEALDEDQYYDIIPLKEGKFLVDTNVYIQLLEATLYNKELDPYNIPNVNFTLISRDDKRWEEYKQQRLEEGFDDSETWSLDNTIAKFVLPRLKRYLEIANSHPGNITEAEWDTILNKMIYAFECILDENKEVDDTLIGVKKYEKRSNIIKEGLDLFREYFLDLWW